MTAVNPRDLPELFAAREDKEEQEKKSRKQQKKGPHKLEISGSVTNQGAGVNFSKFFHSKG